MVKYARSFETPSLHELAGQGKGVAARAMVEHIKGVARGQSFCRLSVYTVKECGVVPVHEKRGFKACREEHAKWAESDEFESLTDVYMAATLNRPPGWK